MATWSLMTVTQLFQSIKADQRNCDLTKDKKVSTK